MTNFVQARDLAVSFGNVQALRGVSFDLGVGEIRALCGENGAGKSTLIKLLMGIHQPSAGRIEVNGAVEASIDPRRAQALGFALVSQELSLAPHLSVLDNIWLGDSATPYFYRSRTLRERARRALDLLQVDIHLDAPVSSLTMGQRQLVEIGRMIARDARLLILDEPTATLSDVEIANLFEVLRALRAEGHAILYVTHRLGEVFELCDSVTVLRNGSHVATGPVATFSRMSLVQAMLGRAPSDMYPPRRPAPVHNGGVTVERLHSPDFKDVSFEAYRGRITSVVGQIGSGAGQVIRAVAGLEPLARGVVRVDGQDLTASYRRTSLAFISEDRAKEGLFHRNILENLVGDTWGAHTKMGVVSWSSARLRAEALASAMGVDARRLDASAFDLSGGNQQKVLFARASGGSSAHVLLMNEPTRGVDVGARSDIYRLMRDLCDRGFAIVMSSTDLEEVVGVSDAVVTMYRGAVVGRHEADQIEIARLLLDITHPRQGEESVLEAADH